MGDRGSVWLQACCGDELWISPSPRGACNTAIDRTVSSSQFTGWSPHPRTLGGLCLNPRPLERGHMKMKTLKYLSKKRTQDTDSVVRWERHSEKTDTYMPRREASKAPTMLTPWSQTSKLQDWDRIHFYCSSHTACEAKLRERSSWGGLCSEQLCCSKAATTPATQTQCLFQRANHEYRQRPPTCPSTESAAHRGHLKILLGRLLPWPNTQGFWDFKKFPA